MGRLGSFGVKRSGVIGTVEVTVEVGLVVIVSTSATFVKFGEVNAGCVESKKNQTDFFGYIENNKKVEESTLPFKTYY